MIAAVFGFASASASACSHYERGAPVPLRWTGVDAAPIPSPEVRSALAATPFAFGLRDVRRDPAQIGGYEDSPAVVRTPDNVAQYCTQRLGDMLLRAGARLADANPALVLQAELVEYEAVEGEDFNGRAQIRATLSTGGATVWTRTYSGGAKRWGRTHDPERVNEVLSNALASIAAQLLSDGSFAAALRGQPALAPPSAAP
ncbi:MAG TPA: hypothetical protein VFP84_09460 [Kofleriaceae bacterium]|nr:hypothetical protein [Kofleriaceae bacterium]